jgi:hypothetical protein
MNSPRSLRSPRGTPTKSTQIFVNLYKSDFPDDPPSRVRLPKSLKELQVVAQDILELYRPVQQIFDADGNLITTLDRIPAEAKLFVSCAKPIREEPDGPVYKSRLPPPNKPKLAPAPKPPKVAPRPDNAVQHQAIAASSYTVKENLRDSLLSLYASPRPSTRPNCPVPPHYKN